MALSPATRTDLSNRSLRPLTEPELAVGETLLDDAWSIIVSARPSVETRVEEGTPAFVRLVVQVQCAMVLRVLSNPDGKLEESVDDYRYRLDQAVSTGALYLADGELVRLAAGDSNSDGAFTIDTRPFVGRGYWASTDLWVPLTP